MKISEFINSMEGEELDAATCLMGGATGDGAASPHAKTNGMDWSNSSMGECNESTNNGSCTNVSGMCNDSTNGGACKS